MNSCDLNEARKKLDESLGSNKALYYHQMKQWFQMKYTREQFSLETKNLLSHEQLKLHNAFLLALFQTCNFPLDSDDTTTKAASKKSICNLREKEKGKDKDRDKSKKSKSRRRTRSDRSNFEYADYKDYLPTLYPLSSKALEEPVRYCHEELFLPDSSHTRGRLLIAAWECGLEGASEQSAEVIVIAVQYFLKNILMSIFSQRSGYKVQDGIQFSMGCTVPNPLLRNSSRVLPSDCSSRSESSESEEDSDESCDSDGVPEIKRFRPSLEEIERRAIYEMSLCKPQTSVKAPVSLFDLLEALQTDRKSIPIPSHSLYSVNVAKIIAELYHPSSEELEVGCDSAK